MSDPSEATSLVELSSDDSPGFGTRRRSASSRVMYFIRRVHLYAGLVFFPWVILYGVTGAMFSHPGLFPHAPVREIDPAVTAEAMAAFPAPESLAADVTRAINERVGSESVVVADEPKAEFTNELMFAASEDGETWVTYLHPTQHTAWIGMQKQIEQPEDLLTDVKNVTLPNDPQEMAREAAREAFLAAGFEPSLDIWPHGWTKLNFLATVNQQPARVTYVLKDGHVDVVACDGGTGMSPQQMFMRLHTTHGQSPHVNGRWLWVLVADGMALAMVTWGVSGLLMWWQIKRTRILGGLIVVSSGIAAVLLFLSVQSFYATTTM